MTVMGLGDEGIRMGGLGSLSQSLLSSLFVKNLVISLSRLWHFLHWLVLVVVQKGAAFVAKASTSTSASTATAGTMMSMSMSAEPVQFEEQEHEVTMALSLSRVPDDIHISQDNQEDSCSGYCSGSGSSIPGSPVPSSKEDNDHDHQGLLSSDQEHDVEDENEKVTVTVPLAGQQVISAPAPPRRDSYSSTASESAEVEVSAEVVGKILAQVESMFSDDHLAKDGFLLKHVRRRSDGYVSLKLVAGLRKVKQISREFNVVLAAVRTSDKLEVNSEGTKVRRKDPLTQDLKAMPIKQAKKEKVDKENVAANGNLTDEQQIRNKRRQKGDRLNELHGPAYHQNQNHYNSNSYKTNNASGRSSIDESSMPQVIRRRGGSLPVPVAALSQHRGSTAGNFMCPNPSSNSPPTNGFLRPKSYSYSEGTDNSATMSSWLQKRKASAASSRLSSGEISLNGVIRQPRGPDGTRGFHAHFRVLPTLEDSA